MSSKIDGVGVWVGLWKFLFLWVPVALYVGCIFWISSHPRPIPGMTLFPHMDKVFHTIEYTPLGTLLLRAIHRSHPSLTGIGGWILALGMATAVGSWDEYLQSFIPLKVSSQWDLVFDVLGAGLGQGLYGWFRSKVARTP